MYEGKITVGYRNGKPFRKSVYGKTEREYLAKVYELLNQSPSLLLANKERVTLERWLEKYVEFKSAEARPSTVLKYRQYMRYVVAELGSAPLVEIKSFHLESFFGQLAKRGLSPSIRKQTFHFLRDALRRAYRHELIPGNPMDKVDCPKGGQVRKTGAWTSDEVARLLAVAEGTRWYAPIVFALTTALRPGELLSLRWSDIQGSQVHVRRTLLRAGPNAQFGEPKTKSSERIIYLDTETLALLEQHRYELEREKALARTRWREFGLVFPTTLGTPINHNNFRRALHELADAAGIPRRSPHELRHTSITLFRRVADVKLVSRKAGHADTLITDRIYNHVRHEDLKALAIPLSRLLAVGRGTTGDDI